MVLEIEVQGARQVRETLPDAVQVFIARRRARRCARGSWAAGPTTPSRSQRAPAHGRGGARRPDEFAHVVVNDRLEEAVERLADRAEERSRARGYTPAMINPRIDKLLEHVDSNYASVLVAAKRARQINSYYHNLGEGTFDEFPPPMVEPRRRTT